MHRHIILILFLLALLTAVHADERFLSLTFVGDIMAHDVNYRMSDYGAIYANLRSYFENDDLSFANLEFPVVDDLPFASYPLFNVQPSYVRAALHAGIEVFSLANNHSLDKGELGVLKTLASLILLKEEANGELFYSGIRGDTDKPFAPVTIYKKGLKIGFLAVTQFVNVTQTNPYIDVVDYLDKEAADKFVEWIRSITPQYDLFILSFHGDSEYSLTPAPEKQKFFHALIEAGVTIIWSHHPHVLQPFELVDVGGAKRLIMYSLGNFVSGQGFYVSADTPTIPRAFTADSFLFRVTVVKSGRGQASVSAVDPVLISDYTTPAKDIIVDRLEKLASSPLYGNWQEYYKVRLGVMRQFLENMSTYLLQH